MSEVLDIAEDRADRSRQRGGGLERDRTSLRRCCMTRKVLPKDRMLRFVIGPNNEIVPDIDGRLPGRGLWLTLGRKMVEAALAKKMFARAARGPVSAPEDLAARIDGLLVRRCLHCLGLARRTGAVVTGLEKVREQSRGGEVSVLLVASDGGGSGRKLEEALSRRDGVSTVRLFDAEQLSQALGRPHVVHVAIARGPIAERFSVEAARLAAYRGVDLTGRALCNALEEG
ncbi:MAG: RNA-binding protein [Alphaproteobacteria bacterium]|nr:RNA-binding protein [Alphaproteobacteria bacterium]